MNAAPQLPDHASRGFPHRCRGLSLPALIGDEVRFVRGWVSGPRKIGAISPSSRALARLMVRCAQPEPEGYTLELGPGTGVATLALIEAGVAPDRIVAVEHNGEFCRLLEKRFPRLNVVHGDAFDLDTALAGFSDIRLSSALSGLPLLSFPLAMRLKCVEGVLDRLPKGRPLVQFSYGVKGPIGAMPGRIAVSRSKWVVLNLPPARAWIYTRP